MRYFWHYYPLKFIQGAENIWNITRCHKRPQFEDLSGNPVEFKKGHFRQCTHAGEKVLVLGRGGDKNPGQNLPAPRGLALCVCVCACVLGGGGLGLCPGAVDHLGLSLMSQEGRELGQEG